MIETSQIVGYGDMSLYCGHGSKVTCGYVATMIAKSSIFHRFVGSPAADVNMPERGVRVQTASRAERN